MGKYLEKLRATNRKSPGRELTLLTKGAMQALEGPYVSNVSSLGVRLHKSGPNNVDDLRECFEERAGIMEHDGQLLRQGAESAALGCMSVQIEWPPLPHRNLAGAALSEAWAAFWNVVESQLKGHAHAN